MDSTNDSRTAAPVETASGDLRWKLARTPVALILLVAAGVKSVRVDEILAMDGLLSSQPLLFSVLAFEAAIATYILIAPPQWSWPAAIGTFVLLTIAATYSLVTQTDCHCFGDRIGAKLTLPLDLITLLIVYLCRPRPWSRKRGSITGTTMPPLAAAACIVWFAQSQVGQELAPEWKDIDVLVAEQWVGRPWPLTESGDKKLQQLRSGKWLVLVVRRDCEHCLELLHREFPDPKRHRNGERTALFIAGEQSWPVQLDRVSLNLEGNTSISWRTTGPFVASPAVFYLENGTVIEAADGRESGKFLRDHFADAQDPIQ